MSNEVKKNENDDKNYECHTLEEDKSTILNLGDDLKQNNSAKAARVDTKTSTVHEKDCKSCADNNSEALGISDSQHVATVYVIVNEEDSVKVDRKVTENVESSKPGAENKQKNQASKDTPETDDSSFQKPEIDSTLVDTRSDILCENGTHCNGGQTARNGQQKATNGPQIATNVVHENVHYVKNQYNHNDKNHDHHQNHHEPKLHHHNYHINYHIHADPLSHRNRICSLVSLVVGLVLLVAGLILLPSGLHADDYDVRRVASGAVVLFAAMTLFVIGGCLCWKYESLVTPRAVFLGNQTPFVPISSRVDPGSARKRGSDVPTGSATNANRNSPDKEKQANSTVTMK